MRTLLLVVIALGVGVASLKIVPAQTDQVDERAIAECSRGFTAGVRASAGKKRAKYLAEDKLEAAARPLCEFFVARPALHGLMVEDPHAAHAVALRDAPRAGVPFCNFLVEFDLAASARPYRFASTAEKNSYQRAHCNLAIRYADEVTGVIDRKRLSSENASLYLPLCASIVQHGASSERTHLTPNQIKTLARRSCSRALKQGVFTTGQFGIGEAKVNGKRFAAIVSREANRVGRV